MKHFCSLFHVEKKLNQDIRATSLPNKKQENFGRLLDFGGSSAFWFLSRHATLKPTRLIIFHVLLISINTALWTELE